MSKKLAWSTATRKVKDLIPCALNPNINSDAQFVKLKASIKRDGYVEIIVIDIDGRIAAGNHRHRALMELGMAEKEVDVRVPNRRLTKEEFDRYLIASNALHGEWDFSVLKDYDPDLLLQLLNDEDLSRAFDDASEIKNDYFDEKKEIERAKTTEIKPGDMFALGRHRLICSDATDPESAKKLMGDARADLIDIDGPFAIGLDYGAGVGGKANYGGTFDDNMDEKEYRAFVRSLMQNALSVAKPDVHSIFWCDERWVYLFQELYKELGIHSLRLCIWLKNNQSPTASLAFNKVTEFAVYGTVGHPYLNPKVTNLNEVMNKEVGTGNQLSDDILDLLNIWLVKRLAGNDYEHPTQKSPTLHEKALRRCTRPGDIVLDLTAGSGSILAACEQLGRTAYLCEMEPVFCQVIVNRYQRLTGLKAQKI